ncbi:MAG: OmpA family protein [Deltaproteobacteria bacterium]|nr:OmpA family protein [Deltaproteobacteria bacterium]
MKLAGWAVPAILVVSVSTANAGWIGETLQGALKRMGLRAVDEAADGAYEKARGTVAARDGAGAEEDVPQPTPWGKEQEMRPGKRNRSPHPVPTTGKELSGESGEVVTAGNVASRYDFVPGDRALFLDDFSETNEGEFPRKWTIRGPGVGIGYAPLEVVRYNGGKYLRYKYREEEKRACSILFARLKVGKDMPEKFTVEFDALFPPNSSGNRPDPEYRLLLVNHRNKEDGLGPINEGEPNVVLVGSFRAVSANTYTRYEKGDGRLHRVEVSVNGTFVKAYVDGERVINDPEALARPLTFVGLALVFRNGPSVPPLMFTNFRVAAGGKEIKAALDTDGRIVTHGIRFDTGSAEIRRESFPTLEGIRALLDDAPSLRFSIEGHTDNQGGTAVNQPLSERRAEAVKAWFVGRGIAAERLTIRGWGQTQPLDANDTAEGRANNRRVEFVRVP